MPIFGRLWRKSRTIYDCCRVICQIQYYCGCNGMRRQGAVYVCDRKSLAYTFLMATTVLAVLLGVIYAKSHDSQFANIDSLIQTIIFLELCTSLFMYLATVITMVAKTKPHLELYRRLNQLDRILMQEFHCNLNYHRHMMRHVSLLMAFCSIYLSIIVLCASRASDSLELLINLLGGLAYCFLTGGPHFNGFAQMNIASILRMRFISLQKLLMSTCHNNSQMDEDQQIERLQRLIELVQSYYDCVRITNKIFSTSMLSTMLHDFTLTTSELYLIFSGSAKADYSIIKYFLALATILPFLKMTLAPMYSEKAIEEVEQCFSIIRDLDFSYPGNKKAQDMVFASLMWLQDNRMQFMCGSMILKRESIAGVYMEIFNYILILVQFRMTQEMGNQIEEQKNTIQDWIGVDYV